MGWICWFSALLWVSFVHRYSRFSPFYQKAIFKNRKVWIIIQFIDQIDSLLCLLFARPWSINMSLASSLCAHNCLNQRIYAYVFSRAYSVHDFQLVCLTEKWTWGRREIKEKRGRRQRERHLKMYIRVSALISQWFQVIILVKCVLTFLELNWNQRFGDKKAKLNIFHHMLTSSTHLQNKSFHVVERTRTSPKCPIMKNAHSKLENYSFNAVKYANLWRSCCRGRRGCLKPGFHIVVSAVRNKLIGQIQLYGNLP